MNSKIRTVEDDEGNEIEIDVPCSWKICSTCQGDGKHSHGIGAITSSEWENDWDYDEREAYMSGAYDRTCEDCSGSGKVLSEDYSKLSDSDRKLLEDQDQFDADYERTCAAERRMGA